MIEERIQNISFLLISLQGRYIPGRPLDPKHESLRNVNTA